MKLKSGTFSFFTEVLGEAVASVPIIQSQLEFYGLKFHKQLQKGEVRRYTREKMNDQ